VTPLPAHRRYGLQPVIAVLLAVVMCWLSERTSIARAVSDAPAVECEHADLGPAGKPDDSSAGGCVAVEGADDSDCDAIFVIAAPIELARWSSFRHYDHDPRLSDWRSRSSISARGPPVA
jgi:hypothetical protein